MSKRDTLFKSHQDMVPSTDSPDVVRVALSKEEVRENYRPGILPDPKKDVVNVMRARRGYTTY
jgi:hypothetical protein